MINRLGNKFWVFAVPAIAIESFFLFFYLRNDPEPYHSGLIYAQSIAVSQGLLPNRDFLSPYGITGPLLNGTLFKFADSSLLNLLIFYGLLIITTGLVLYKSISKKIGRINAFALNLVWVMTFTTTLPWPSLLTTFLTLLAFHLVIHSNLDSCAPSAVIKVKIFTAVLLLQLATLTRIHLIAALFFVTLILLFLAGKPIYYIWIKFNLLVAGLLVGLMIKTDVLEGYIIQVIVWPLTGFSKPPMTLGLYFSFVWFPLLSILAYALFWTIRRILAINHKGPMFSALGCLVFMVVLTIYLLSSVNTTSAPPTIRSWLGLIAVVKSNLQVLLGFVAVFGFAVFTSNLIIKHLSRWKSRPLSPAISINNLLAMSMGTTALIQLFPLHDNVHIWFVTPLLVFAFVELIDKDFFSFKSKLSIAVLASFLLLNQLTFWGKSMQIERVPLVSSELTGMYGTPEFSQVVDATMIQMDKIGRSRILRNECMSALYSISNRNFISIDGNFIGNFFEAFTDYMPIVDPQEKDPDYIFKCNSNLEDRDMMLKMSYKIHFKISTLLQDSAGNDLYNVLYMRS
jgi:hypothetical protein